MQLTRMSFVWKAHTDIVLQCFLVFAMKFFGRLLQNVAGIRASALYSGLTA
jgi:hypothetical protein